MRRNRKNSIKKERIIMIASSAFVLAALTMTGVYMKDKNAQSKNDGYMIDFTALEENVDDKYQKIAQNNENMLQNDEYVPKNDMNVALGGNDAGDGQTNMENDLDYMPMEAASHLVGIPGLTDGSHTLSEEEAALIAERQKTEDGGEEATDSDAAEEANADTEKSEDAKEDTQTAGDDVVVKELHFAADQGLVRPTAGEVMMPYSMDASIYFATLDQYKYNPAVMYYAEEGNSVSACAEGRVVSVFEDTQIGNAVTLELGDGYQATYGQLKDIQVQEDSYVNAGDVIGSVAAPTKYFSVEGSNLYFQLTKDGIPVNPEELY